MENSEKTTCESETPPETKRVGCSHYKRRAKFVVSNFVPRINQKY